MRAAVRVRHYSIRTEQAYLYWVRRFILFHERRHPESMGEIEVAAFLSHLATAANVAPATQNQALNAIAFLYSAVLDRPLGELGGIARAKQRERLPVVLTVDEVALVLLHLPPRIWLVACLQYGSGLRLLESVRLRVKDLDFTHRAILVRDGKGGRDRVTTLPDELLLPLERHLAERLTLFERDIAEGAGEVFLPNALARKYPSAPTEWGWQYVFPADEVSYDPRGGGKRRHHLDEQRVQRAVRRAVLSASINPPGKLPYPATFLYHTPTRTRRGYTHGTRATRAPRCAYHADLYPCH
ncbi:MAG: integron integrase [Gammaproteobacteria bacterium]|nr:integron integrase [Gammaproteobacteria bacterium]